MSVKKDQSKNSSKRIRPSIKKDGVSATDYNRYNLPWACEECSHFSHEKQDCTFGFPVEPFLRHNQLKSYFLSGKFALCRFQEID